MQVCMYPRVIPDLGPVLPRNINVYKKIGKATTQNGQSFSSIYKDFFFGFGLGFCTLHS